jgi:hypothetical protein
LLVPSLTDVRTLEDDRPMRHGGAGTWGRRAVGTSMLLACFAGDAIAQSPPAPSTPPPAPSTPPAAAPAPPAAAPTVAPPGAAAPGTTYVAIETDNPSVWLQRRIGSLKRRPEGMATGDPTVGQAPPIYDPPAAYGPYWVSDWERICITPCHKPVASGGIYRIAGDGVSPSEGFPLEGPRANLQVSTGSSSARSAGTYMAVFGFLLAATGGVFLAMSLVSNEKESVDEDQAAIVASTVGIIGGSVIGLAGVGLVLANDTTVRDERGKELARRGGAGQLGLRAYGAF